MGKDKGASKRPNPDDLTKTTDKGEVKLTEEELDGASGGQGTLGTWKWKWRPTD